LKHRFINLNVVAFWAGEEDENDLKVPWEQLKNRFIDFIQVEICACQEAENEFYVPLDHLNRRFIDLNNSHFRLVKKHKMTSKYHSTT